MTQLAKDAGVTMCHENEKGIYGDTAERCLDILNAVPELSAIFDPANFIQCGVDTKMAWEMLGSKIKYLHIKDALADGHVVPAGEGIGNIPYIVEDFIKKGGNSFTVEPHLTVFAALKNLEREGDEIKVGLAKRFPTKPDAFDFACQTFKKIAEEAACK
jgi:sugar phosphate isomerase/epimerase